MKLFVGWSVMKLGTGDSYSKSSLTETHNQFIPEWFQEQHPRKLTRSKNKVDPHFPNSLYPLLRNVVNRETTLERADFILWLLTGNRYLNLSVWPGAARGVVVKALVCTTLEILSWLRFPAPPSKLLQAAVWRKRDYKAACISCEGQLANPSPPARSNS